MMVPVGQLGPKTTAVLLTLHTHAVSWLLALVHGSWISNSGKDNAQLLSLVSEIG